MWKVLHGSHPRGCDSLMWKRLSPNAADKGPDYHGTGWCRIDLTSLQLYSVVVRLCNNSTWTAVGHCIVQSTDDQSRNVILCWRF